MFESPVGVSSTGCVMSSDSSFMNSRASNKNSSIVHSLNRLPASSASVSAASMSLGLGGERSEAEERKFGVRRAI